jgi:hypothetical protein
MLIRLPVESQIPLASRAHGQYHRLASCTLRPLSSEPHSVRRLTTYRTISINRRREKNEFGT